MFRKKTNVLVHCLAGVSRSVTIVLAYMITKKGCRLDEAYDLVRSRRSKVNKRLK
jgi:protein-tyrosine phosphatase